MIYELSWVAYACAGVFKVFGLSIAVASAPPAAYPTLAAVGLCRAEARVERFDPARLELSRRRVRELGDGAVLRRCRGVRCGDNLARWSTELTFKEE